MLLYLLLLFLLTLNCECQQLCNQRERIELPKTSSRSQKIMFKKLNYTKGKSFWQDGDFTFGCPCLVKSCLTLCADNGT